MLPPLLEPAKTPRAWRQSPTGESVTPTPVVYPYIFVRHPHPSVITSIASAKFTQLIPWAYGHVVGAVSCLEEKETHTPTHPKSAYRPGHATEGQA